MGKHKPLLVWIGNTNLFWIGGLALFAFDVDLHGGNPRYQRRSFPCDAVACGPRDCMAGLGVLFRGKKSENLSLVNGAKLSLKLYAVWLVFIIAPFIWFASTFNGIV